MGVQFTQSATLTSKDRKHLSLEDLRVFVANTKEWDSQTKVNIRVMDDQRDGYQATLNVVEGQTV